MEKSGGQNCRNRLDQDQRALLDLLALLDSPDLSAMPGPPDPWVLSVRKEISDQPGLKVIPGWLAQLVLPVLRVPRAQTRRWRALSDPLDLRVRTAPQ